MIVCLSGAKRSGKDTSADVLVKQFNFEKFSLAQPIRELCSVVFEIPIEVFTDDHTKEKLFSQPIILNEAYLGHIIELVEKDWGFSVDEVAKVGMMKQLGVEFIHPRHILQIVGTEVLRNNIDTDIFLKLAQKRIDATNKNVVIADVRFSNERDWFKKQGATLCLVKRPTAKNGDVHSSENDLGEDSDYDTVMINDDSLSKFQIEVSYWINNKINKENR